MFRIQSWWNIWVFFLHKLITIRKADLSPFKRKSRIESAATCLPANINRMSGNTNRPKVCVLTYKQSGLDQSNKRSIASIMVALSDFYLVYIKQIYFHISIYIYIYIIHSMTNPISSKKSISGLVPLIHCSFRVTPHSAISVRNSQISKVWERLMITPLAENNAKEPQTTKWRHLT